MIVRPRRYGKYRDKIASDLWHLGTCIATEQAAKPWSQACSNSARPEGHWHDWLGCHTESSHTKWRSTFPRLVFSSEELSRSSLQLALQLYPFGSLLPFSVPSSLGRSQPLAERLEGLEMRHGCCKHAPSSTVPKADPYSVFGCNIATLTAGSR